VGNKMRAATWFVRFVAAVLVGITAGLNLHKAIREHVREEAAMLNDENDENDENEIPDLATAAHRSMQRLAEQMNAASKAAAERLGAMPAKPSGSGVPRFGKADD
jgi:hypothetical protein